MGAGVRGVLQVAVCVLGEQQGRTTSSKPVMFEQASHVCLLQFFALLLFRSCRIYLAFDEVDAVFNQSKIRDAVSGAILDSVAVEDARRRHPKGYQPGVTLDPSALLLSVHWVGSLRSCLLQGMVYGIAC